MKIGQISTLLGVSSNTVKQWVERFAQHFSDSAKKGSALQRSFTDQDVLVLATIASARAEGVDFDVIGKRIEAGDLVSNPSAANFGVDTRLVPAAQVDAILEASAERVELESALARVSSELATLQQERDRLLDTLTSERQRYDEKLTERDSMIQQLNQQIAELRERVGRAEGQLEEKNKRRWFGS